MTARDAARRAAARLGAAGVPEAAREARLLLTAVAGVDVRLDPAAEIPPGAAEAYRAAVARREGREPYAYITGRREFLDLWLEVDGDVLIPRPETELLAERALALAPPGAAVCDLCTGSGAVALALASRRPDLRVTATDVSPPALAVAARNARRLGLPVRFLPGDLWAALPAGEGAAFAVCTCNPPYVDAADWPDLPPEVRDWEPRLALVPPEGRHAFLQRLVSPVRRHLIAGGWLAVEVGAGQAGGVEAVFRQHGLREVRAHADLAGIPRVVEGRRPC